MPMNNKEAVLQNLEDFKEVIDIKLKDKRDHENSKIGNWGVYHLLYQGWRRFYTQKGASLKNLKTDNSDYQTAIKNLTTTINMAVNNIISNNYETAIEEIAKGKNLEHNFLFITNIFTSMTILYSILDVQVLFFSDCIDLKKKKTIATELIDKKFGSELLFDIIYPAINYWFQRVCNPKKEVLISKELYELISTEHLGSKICTHDGLKMLFESILNSESL